MQELAAHSVRAVQILVELLAQSSFVVGCDVQLFVELGLSVGEGALFSIRKWQKAYVVLEFAETIVLPVAAHFGLVLGAETRGHGLRDLRADRNPLALHVLALQLLPGLGVVLGLVGVKSNLGCLRGGDESGRVEPLVRPNGGGFGSGRLEFERLSVDLQVRLPPGHRFGSQLSLSAILFVLDDFNFGV